MSHDPETPRPPKRTLRFAVTSALVSAPLLLGAGCPSEEKHINPGPIRVNPGPEERADPVEKTEQPAGKTKTERPVGKTKNERPPRINPGPAPQPAKTNPGPTRDK